MMAVKGATGPTTAAKSPKGLAAAVKGRMKRSRNEVVGATGASLSTNEEKLVAFAVQGVVTHPISSHHGFEVTREGLLFALPGVGGIVYSHFVGDPCIGLLGDHIEPGASVANFDKNHGDDAEKSAFAVYAQLGNTAVVASGDAKGCIGTVIGKHGGVEHVIIHFPAAVLDRLEIGDKVRIRAHGMGLAIEGTKGLEMRNTDPRLLARMPVEKNGGRLRVGVAAIVPAVLMGSGIGADNTHRGDYDIQLSDPGVVAARGLDRLRFGDLVAIEDTYHGYGRTYRPGAVSIGVVVHSDSHIAGHGPGVTTLMTSLDGDIEPVVQDGANIADLLGLDRASPGQHHDPQLLARHEEVAGKWG
ncbi:MAG: DUF4438 domain-containing protein [Euryarchaeota archaeon]|nr:DUF4438 domain-containing protein [Euryarchaeota archaeon]